MPQLWCDLLNLRIKLEEDFMLRLICLNLCILGLFTVMNTDNNSFAYGPRFRMSIGPQGYYNGYGGGYYGGYAQSPYENGPGFTGGYGNNYGYNPYGYANTAGNGYANSNYYNGYGYTGYYRQAYTPVYSPFGNGFLSDFTNGW